MEASLLELRRRRRRRICGCSAFSAILAETDTELGAAPGGAQPASGLHSERSSVGSRMTAARQDAGWYPVTYRRWTLAASRGASRRHLYISEPSREFHHLPGKAKVKVEVGVHPLSELVENLALSPWKEFEGSLLRPGRRYGLLGPYAPSRPALAHELAACTCPWLSSSAPTSFRAGCKPAGSEGRGQE